MKALNGLKMIKEEFLKKVNNYGIDLDSFFIVIGHEPKWMYYTGIYQDNKDWVIYQLPRTKVHSL